MIAMEFEDMKKIWDTQNNEAIYGINEQALHNRILSKKQQAQKITHWSELVSMIAYVFTGCFLIGTNLVNKSDNMMMYALAAWMIVSAVCIAFARAHRKNEEKRFDRSMSGDLDHALSTAAYQVQLSNILRWNGVPIGLLTVLAVWDGGKSPWLAVGMGVFFALATWASGWEHGIYVKKKRGLEVLKEKLAESEF